MRIHKHLTWQSAVVLASVLFLRFWPLFSQNKTLYFGDNYSLFVPGKLFTAYWLNQGILPLWNPSIFGGISWIGDISQSILHPSTLLFVFFDPGTALNLLILSCFSITLFSMYFFASELTQNNLSASVAAVIWTLSPVMTAAIGNIPVLQSLSLTPLLMLLSYKLAQNKQYFYCFTFILVAHIAGGYPQHLIYTLPMAIVFFWLSHTQNNSQKQTQNRSAIIRQFLFFFAAVGVSLALSAVYWLPFTQTLQQSTRTTQTVEQAVTGSVQPMSLVTGFVPYLFEKPSLGMKWGPSWSHSSYSTLFIPWMSILLVLSAIPLYKTLQPFQKKVLATLFLMVGISLTLSFGKNLPGYLFLLEHLSLLQTIRTPSTALLVSQFGLSLIIGMAYPHIKISSKNLKKLLLLLTVLTLSMTVMYLIVTTNFSPVWYTIDSVFHGVLSQSPFHTVARDRVIISTVVENIAFFVLGLTLLVAAQHKSRKWLVVFLIAVESLYATQGQLFFAPKNIYTSPSQKQTELLSVFPELRENQFRLLVRNYNAPYTDFAAYYEATAVRAPFSDSYIYEEELNSLDQLQRLATGFTPNWNQVSQVNTINGYTTLVPTVVDKIWNSSSDNSTNRLPTISIGDPLLDDHAVKYYLVDTWFHVTDNFENWELIHQKDSWSLYQNQTAKARFRGSNETNIAVTLISETPNQIVLQTTTQSSNDLDSVQRKAENSEKSLLIADTYDSDWKSIVNDQNVSTIEASGLRKIPLRSDNNQILHRYQPKLFYLGAGISVITLFLMTLIGAIIRPWHSKLPSIQQLS